jgi:hypothetical protein
MRAAAILICVVLIGFAEAANGCSVTITTPLKYAFKDASIVFEGRLISISDDGSAEFEVTRVLKGTSRPSIVVANSRAHAISKVGARVKAILSSLIAAHPFRSGRK